jgi:hypothetical protein
MKRGAIWRALFAAGFSFAPLYLLFFLSLVSGGLASNRAS